MHAGRADDGSGDNGLETRTDKADLQCGANNGHAGKGVTGTTSTAHSSRSRNDFDWVNPDSADDGFPRRYRFPTLGADHADFVRARADPLACNLDNDMVLLWNEVEIEARGGAGIGKPPSEESIEDAYQRLYSAAVRHREDLQATLRDAGLERVNDFFTDSDSACGGFDDGREDVEGDVVCGDNDDDNAHDADDDVFDDSGVRGSWEFLSDDGADGAGQEDDPLTQEIDLLRNSYDGACAVGYPEVSIPGDQLDGDKGTYGLKQEQLVEGQPGVKHIRQQHDREVVQTSSSGDSVSINSYNSSSKDSNNNNKSIGNNNDFKNVSSSSYITTNNINGGDSTRGVPEHGSSNCPAALTSGLLSHSSSRFDSGHYDTTSCSSEDDHPFSETGHAAVDTPRPGLHSSQAVSSPGRNIPVGDLGDNVGMDLGDPGPDRLLGHNSQSLGSADAEVFEDNGDLLTHRPTLGEENPHNRYPKEDRVYPDVFPKNSDTEKLQGNPPNDHDILMPHLIQPQPYPTPVHSPPANMEQFRPETNESSSSKFLSSSPIPARSRKFYANSSSSPQSSSVLNHPVESQPQLTTGDPDWGGMSILPLVASPHHHDLPVIDAPGSYSPTLVRCHAPDCGKTAALDIARHLYKNCHNCRGSYYCSRKCRHRDWKRHKHDVCHGSRVSSACKRVIEFCGLDPDVKSALSRLARRGFLSYGRGCVMLGFPDLRATEEFLCDGLKSPKGDCCGSARSLQLLPVYVSLSELRGSKMYGGAEILQRLMTLCETYNPELKFLLNVGIGVRWNREQMLRTQTSESNDQVGSFQYKPTVNGRTVLSESSEMPSFAGSSPNGGCMQSPKESSFSFHSTTIDSGYGDHQRSTPSKHPRSRDTGSRGRSVSVNSEDVGYGSLGDIRDSLAYSPASPGQSFADGAVFHSVQPPPSSPHPSPLSPPMNGENVVYYWDAEPRLKCPILQKCACLRLFNPAFDPPSYLPSYPHLANVPQDRKVSLPTRSVKNLSYLNPMVWPRRCGPTLILTDVPGSWYEAQDEFRLRELGPRTSVTAIRNDVTTKRAVQGKARELCFSNIQRRLRQRGVSLRRQFPEVYDELVEYVSGDTEHFPSRIIFPVDEHGSGRMFTCVLMPEAEPDLRWTQTAKLLDNLDISRERVWGPLVSARLVRPSQAESGPHPTGSAENTEFSSQANLPQPVGDGTLGSDAKDCVGEGYSGDQVCVTKLEGGSDSHNVDKNQCNIEVQQRNNLRTPSNTQTITKVCPRCLTRTTLVDGSTQTGVPINTTKVKATVPDLITQCPTSSSMRRRFNTNFPIFSFDLDILEMLTSWANSKSKDSKHSQKTMAPLLLGHLACSSLLLRYQNHHASSTETQVHQQCPIVSSQTNESAKFSGRCPVANSGNRQSGAYLPHSSTVRESQQKESKSFYHHNSSPHKIPTTACNSSNFYPAFDQRESSVVSGCDRKLPSQDQVDCILKDWGNSSRANHHGNHKDAIPVEDSVPWSCRQCNNRHPHNHPYKDPESIRRQIQGSRVQFKPNFPTSVTSPLSGSSNLKYHNHHHYPLSHQRLRHSHLRQQQVNATENLQSDW